MPRPCGLVRLWARGSVEAPRPTWPEPTPKTPLFADVRAAEPLSASGRGVLGASGGEALSRGIATASPSGNGPVGAGTDRFTRRPPTAGCRSVQCRSQNVCRRHHLARCSARSRVGRSSLRARGSPSAVRALCAPRPDELRSRPQVARRAVSAVRDGASARGPCGAGPDRLRERVVTRPTLERSHHGPSSTTR
jgi:hypothetical protein